MPEEGERVSAAEQFPRGRLSDHSDLFTDIFEPLFQPGRELLRRFLAGNTDEDSLGDWLEQLLEEDVGDVEAHTP